MIVPEAQTVWNALLAAGGNRLAWARRDLRLDRHEPLRPGTWTRRCRRSRAAWPGPWWTTRDFIGRAAWRRSRPPAPRADGRPGDGREGCAPPRAEGGHRQWRGEILSGTFRRASARRSPSPASRRRDGRRRVDIRGREVPVRVVRFLFVRDNTVQPRHHEHSRARFARLPAPPPQRSWSHPASEIPGDLSSSSPTNGCASKATARPRWHLRPRPGPARRPGLRGTPNVGDTVEAGNACAVVESVKAASDVRAGQRQGGRGERLCPPTSRRRSTRTRTATVGCVRRWTMPNSSTSCWAGLAMPRRWKKTSTELATPASGRPAAVTSWVFAWRA